MSYTKEIKSFSVGSVTPFKVDATFSQNQYTAVINPGTINNIMPINIIDGSILRKFAYSANTLTYVILKCTGSSSGLSAAKVELSSQVPSLQKPVAFGLPSSVDIILAILYNSSVFQCVINNITLSGKLQYIDGSKVNPTPGGLPYIAFYTWG
jgi:hypothetical protein